MSRRGGTDNTIVIETPAGAVSGAIDTASGTCRFLGIPYAYPPVGKLRWGAPQPLPPWRGPRPATHFGMPAAQNASPLIQVRGPNGELPHSEDCLYLNIYAPPVNKRRQTKLPVMLWVHGGSFYLGSGCQAVYRGNYLAASGRAIVVTFNYRLGALGFLRLRDISDIPSTGNEGLLDQIAALDWVRNNISAFGGDPDNITLFGESAGAMSIATLFSIPGCRGKFHRAIVQSGNSCALHTVDRATNLAQAFVDHLKESCGCTPAEASTQQLLHAQQATLSDVRMEQGWGQLPFKPVLDGELLRSTPVEALRSGSGSEVSLLLGNNLDEWNLFSATSPESFSLDDQKIRARLGWLLPTPQLEKLLDHYRRRAETLSANPWPLWSRTWNLMLTDMVFTLPGLRMLQAHGGKRFHYHFAQPLASQPLLGACHAVELGYVFGTHAESALQDLYGGERNAQQLSHSMREAWLNFAETGEPGDDWPAFTTGHSRRFGEHPEERPFDAAELTELWQAVPDEVLHRYL